MSQMTPLYSTPFPPSCLVSIVAQYVLLSPRILQLLDSRTGVQAKTHHVVGSTSIIMFEALTKLFEIKPD